MNILSHIHIHRIPNPSGVGRVIDQMLVTHGKRHPEVCHRMLVAAHQYDEVYLQLSDFWKMATFIPHSHGISWQQAKWIWRNKPVAEQYWDKVDIVYCPAESYVPTRKAKLVCTIHDVAGFERDLYPCSSGLRWHRQKWSVLFRQMELHADAIVTVSNFSAKRIAHFFPGLESKLRVIYNAPHGVFGAAMGETALRECERLAEGRKFILVPGGLSLRKNADLVLEAIPLLAKVLPDIKLIVAGRNDAEYVRMLKGMERGNVVFPGYLSDEVINALYAEAELIWFPSRYEGFGMPVIEAMAAGTPVVASNASSIPEVTGGAAMLCDKDDAGQHVEAIRSIVQSSELRDELRAKARVQARKFLWESSADQLQELFQSL